MVRYACYNEVKMLNLQSSIIIITDFSPMGAYPPNYGADLEGGSSLTHIGYISNPKIHVKKLFESGKRFSSIKG